MTKEDRDRAQARADKAARAATGREVRQGRPRRQPAKAVLDNMAKLKALRLAREAAEPQRASRRDGRKEGAAPRRQDGRTRTPAALSDWLASQQNGGRRT